ncbi:MAG TPA: GGDEF domain-containing protein [Terracidiphilus sp.]|jgi:diguanylate cyclase (GGDEF)-like protein
MISLRKYLDSQQIDSIKPSECSDGDMLLSVVDAYGCALMEMGNSSLEACPVMGEELKRNLSELKASLSPSMSAAALATTDSGVREQLRGWGHGTAKHYQQKACEVKEILLMMARTAESVGARDQRCAGQMSEVTQRLRAIASLDDLTEIRMSIERSANELKSSIDRMTAEGKAVLDHLKEQVASYQTKLEEAEEIASRDALTGLSSRLYVEGQLEKRMGAEASFCVAIVDIDHFKKVNDDHGHVTGDDLLKQFGREMRSACRATDLIGRWGGDEFILLFDCGLAEAEAQTVRLRKWICGSYTVRGKAGEVKLRVDASIGLAERATGEELKELLARADAAMYEEKAAGRAKVA